MSHTPDKEFNVLVDLWFPINGRTLPSDHGYAMYGALCRIVPELHGAEDWGLHTLRGRPLGPGIVALLPVPRLGIRLPTDRIEMALSLAGRTLDVKGHFVTLASPTVMPLRPASALSSRIVTIKSFMDPLSFADAVRRQLLELADGFRDAVVTVGARKVITIGGRRVVGFSVRVAGLSDDLSVRLQEQGVGGRRKMGCGVFRKSERELAVDSRPLREAAE